MRSARIDLPDVLPLASSVPITLGAGGWYRHDRYRVAALVGGDIYPGVAADLIRRRYALPMSLTPEQILVATPAEIAAAMRVCSYSDVIDHTRASATTSLINGIPRTVAVNQPAFDDRGLALFGPAMNYVKKSSHTDGHPWDTSTHNGITAAVVATGAVGDVSYADFALTGTNSAVWSEPFVTGLPSLTSAFAIGDPFCASVYASVPGDFPVGPILSVGVQEEGGAGTLTGGSAGVALTATPQRITFSRQISSPAAAFVRSSIGLERLGEPGTTTFTGQVVRVYGWQLEKSYFASPLIQTLNGDIATRAADNCKLTPRARALMARAGCGLIVQGSAMIGSSGRIIGGVSSRVTGFDIPQDKVLLGSTDTIEIGMTTVPTPAFGLAAGWDGTGKAGSYQGAATTASASPLDADLSDIYLGRDHGGTFANGYLQGLVIYPARPADAALPGKATPHV